MYIYSLYYGVTSSSHTIDIIHHQYRRLTSSKSDQNIHFSKTLIYSLLATVFLSWLIIILLQSGDIHPNPGPLSDPSTDSSLESSFSSASSISDLLSSHLSLVHYNVQSIRSKVDILSHELSQFDIVTFSETWLNESVDDGDLAIPSYRAPERRDRYGDSHGGVLVYVKDSIPFRRRQDLELNGLECIWIELFLNHRHILIGTYYRPPNSGSIYQTMIEDSLHLAFDTQIKDIVVTGDFNYNMLNPSTAQKVLSICQQFNLHQTIAEPTNFTEHSSSLIDILLVSDLSTVASSGVGEPFLDQQLRYHCPVFGLFKFGKPKSKSYLRKIWKYDLGDYDLLRNKISNTDWSLLAVNDLNTHAKNIGDHIFSLCESCIPNKTVRIRPSDPPWITSALKRRIRARKRAYRKAKITQSTSQWEKFKRLRNETINLLRTSKKAYYDNISRKLSSQSLSSKDWWRILKSFITPTQKASIPPLKNNDMFVSNDLDKANLLNSFFKNQTLLNDCNKIPPDLPLHNPDSSLGSFVCTPIEVQSTLKSLTRGKAAGPDGIDNRILIEAATELSFPLCDIFNKSVEAGKMPDCWKEAHVCAVLKKGDPSIVSNYRPISLLNTIEKVFERLVFKHTFNFLRTNNFLSPMQSGFVPGDSTVNQLTYLYNNFCKALDAGKEVRVVFFDISKAFDRVWHKGLLVKLKAAGISGKLLLWFSDYLKNRRQCVVLPGTKSPWTSIEAGVPQGSILGPLLFLVFINDIVKDIDSDIRLFADDTSLSLIVDHPVHTATILNSDILKISEWADKWLVTFNPTKTESMLLSRKMNKPHHPPLIMLNQSILEVTSHKHLGALLSNDGTWHQHIDYVKEKTWARINVMKRLKYQLDRKSLETIYFSFIRPLMEYADVIWDNCTAYEKQELDKIQNEAARIVSGTTKVVSLQELYLELGWETLESRRRKHKLISFFKMKNDISPHYLSSLTPPSVGSGSNYSLRNANDVKTVHSRTSCYYNSFLPSVVREWNSLDTELQNSTSLSSFKSLLNKDVRRPPKYYFYGSRNAQVLHSRLRTQCSSLNHHLYMKNLIDSPLCRCGAVESTNHFFFTCPMLLLERDELFRSISPLCNITLSVVLYGCPDRSYQFNVSIFDAVHKYIQSSKRF